MRIVVTSDSHRSESNLFDIAEMHIKDADLFINLGDGENEVDDLALAYPNLKIERVSGNCDWRAEFPLYKTITAAGKRIFFSHGHPFRVKFGYEEIIQAAKAEKADICLFGHTHNQFAKYMDGLYVMNPGAVLNGKYGMVDITPSGIMLIPAKL